MKQGENIAMEDDPNAHANTDPAEQGRTGDKDQLEEDISPFTGEPGKQSGRVRGKLRTEDREDVDEGRQSER